MILVFDLCMYYIYYGCGFVYCDYLDLYFVCMKVILKMYCFVFDYLFGLLMMVYCYLILVNKMMCVVYYCCCEQVDYQYYSFDIFDCLQVYQVYLVDYQVYLEQVKICWYLQVDYGLCCGDLLFLNVIVVCYFW